MSLSIDLMVLQLAVLEVDAMETFCNEFFSLSSLASPHQFT